MKLANVGLVIASRELELADSKKVTIFIGKPERFPGGNHYYCPYQIAGIRRTNIRYAAGIDAVQALELVFGMIGADLCASEEWQTGKLSWDGGSERGDLGFPMPRK